MSKARHARFMLTMASTCYATCKSFDERLAVTRGLVAPDTMVEFESTARLLALVNPPDLQDSMQSKIIDALAMAYALGMDRAAPSFGLDS